jgi:hypothetical protein
MPYPVITRIFINFRFSKMWKFVTGVKELAAKKSKKDCQNIYFWE